MAKAVMERNHHQDWCHICGCRTSQNINIFYPTNAENRESSELSRYLRMCAGCIKRASLVTEGWNNVCQGCSQPFPMAIGDERRAKRLYCSDKCKVRGWRKKHPL